MSRARYRNIQFPSPVNFSTTGYMERMSATQVRELLLATKYPEGELLLGQLFSMTQEEKESLIEFASRLECILYKLLKLANSTYKGGYSELLKINFFRGVWDDRLQDALQLRKETLTTFTQMLKEARRIEYYLSL